MISNHEFNIDIDSTNTDLVTEIELVLKEKGIPLRWFITKVKKKGTKYSVRVEATIIKDKSESFKIKKLSDTDINSNDSIFVNIVPTGIQASIGGSLGDAMPVNNFLSSIGNLVTHPNVCNGGPLLLADRKSFLYTEGFALDLWSKGEINLQSATGHKIGVIIDSGVNDKWTLDRTMNAIQGFYAHTGANIIGIEMTKSPIGGKIRKNESGAFGGDVKNIDTVFNSTKSLIKKGATAIAVFSYIEVNNKDWTQYFKDNLPNPVGGVETIISHSITRKFGIPAAHGPLVKKNEDNFIRNVGQVRPPAALEAASPFYIWCVLRGLQDAPVLTSPKSKGISFTNVSVLLCPATSLGGIPMLQAKKENIPIIAIKQNTTVLNVTAKDLNYSNVIEVESYVIAAGILVIAKNQKDFSLTNLKKISQRSEKSLKKIGTEYFKSIEINPLSVERPIECIK